VLHERVGSNVVSDRSFCYGDPDAAFAAAPHRVALTVNFPRNSCTPIETAVVIAEFVSEQDGYDIQSNFMGPFSLHTVMAMALKVPGNRLRHRTFADSGGSFGVKQAVMAPAVLMCLAARKAGAPVKWVEDRLEHLTAATSATGRLCHAEAAVEADGRIVALSLDQFDDCGGYLRAPEPATFYRMHGCLTGAYAIEHLRVRNRVVLTNKTPTGLVRGFGGPQVYYALERLVQRVSVELGLDPLDVYRRNFIAADAFPYRAAAGALLDSGDYQAALALAVRDGGLAELRQRQEAARAEGRLYGIGFAAIVEPSISNMGYITTALPREQRAKAGPKNGGIATATVGIDPLGGLNVVVASSPAGQGHRTVCAQVAADVFGVDPSDVSVNVEFDTQSRHVHSAHAHALGAVEPLELRVGRRVHRQRSERVHAVHDRAQFRVAHQTVLVDRHGRSVLRVRNPGQGRRSRSGPLSPGRPALPRGGARVHRESAARSRRGGRGLPDGVRERRGAGRASVRSRSRDRLRRLRRARARPARRHAPVDRGVRRNDARASRGLPVRNAPSPRDARGSTRATRAARTN